MNAKSIAGNSPQEIETALVQNTLDGFNPTLALVFISVKQDRVAICKILNDKGIQTFGSTTSGEFISPEISEGGIVIMLLDINPAYFKLQFCETGEHTTFDNAKQLGIEGKNTFANPAFIIATGWLHIDGEMIIEGIIEG